MQKLIESICQQIGEFIELKHNENQLIYASHHDALTKFLNRSVMKEKINNVLETAVSPIAVLIFEISRFKFINSAIGPDASDQLLQLIAERLCKVIPEYQNQLARFESSKFAYYFPVNAIDDTVHCAHTILRIFNEPFFINGNNIDLAANIGIAVYPRDDETNNSLFKNADIALNQAIAAGDNNYIFCHPDARFFSFIDTYLILSSTMS